MRLLWAPWRKDYVTRVDKEGCFLCQALRMEDGVDNLVLKRGKEAFIILNRYPYNSGHLMVAPLRHVGEILELKEEEERELWEFLKTGIRIIRKVYSPQGLNIGINLGRPAGAGLVSHLHIHIVPRWEGDTNFLPLLSETKVIPESLEESYKKLFEAFSD